MNRLAAANLIKNYCSGRFTIKSPYYVFVRHFDYEQELDGDITPPGLYAQTVLYNDGSPHHNGWVKFGWKDLLKIIRGNHPRREDGQCNHRYNSGAACTVRGEHEHCRSCDEETIWSLCIICQGKSNKSRDDISKLIADYQNKFGQTFKSNKELIAYMTGGDEYYSPSNNDREDFHSDV